jgi:CspA family cold shock protein
MNKIARLSNKIIHLFQEETMMHKGMVKWFNDLKGYGFIISKELPQELYVRFTEIRAKGYRTLKEGDEVQFEIDEASDGCRATNVVKL